MKIMDLLGALTLFIKCLLSFGSPFWLCGFLFGVGGMFPGFCCRVWLLSFLAPTLIGTSTCLASKPCNWLLRGCVGSWNQHMAPFCGAIITCITNTRLATSTFCLGEILCVASGNHRATWIIKRWLKSVSCDGVRSLTKAKFSQCVSGALPRSSM